MTQHIEMAAEIAEVPGGLAGKSGVLPRQDIRVLVARGMIRAEAGAVKESQYQPASLDLRLGTKAYRVRASFLPGPQRTVEQALADLTQDEVSLADGAILEKNCVYVVELMEALEGLPATISAFANPKSSTGRLDVFTRLIADRAEAFDTVPGGYTGKLYAEISPSSFSIRVRTGTRLNQLRFRRRTSSQDQAVDFRVSDKELRELHGRSALVDSSVASIRNGLLFSVHLAGAAPGEIVGYQAQRFTDVIDLDRIGHYAIDDFWTPIPSKPNGRLILDPHQFYILASKERLHIPAGYAAEMAPIDPTMGEFRVHYAGFFDPGFGAGAGGMPGSRGVLEVRSHEVPFVLEDGQVVGRLAFEKMAAEPDALYGAIGTSNYQGQGLKLSKHFRA